MTRNRRASLAACALAPLALAGVAGAAAPNLVLVSIDTLRSDRLPVYGYARGATPAIDALAADSILFEHAYAHAVLTLPSHASMFTGLLPGEHGVRDNMGYRLDAAKHPTVAQLLAARGYATAAAVSSYVLRPETGIDAGFAWYEAGLDPGTSGDLGLAQRPGAETLRHALGWLAGVAKERRPFFLFVHFYEPHSPYEPEEPFASRFADPYDGEVAVADRLVGELVAELERLGLYDGAAVMLLSDHGEGLEDHGEREHGIFLYREAIQVPLLLKLPGGERRGTRMSAPAQLIDVAPTLLELAGAKVPRALAGASLLSLRSSAEPRRIVSETVYPRLHMGWSDLISMVEHPFHLIEGPDPELYDLIADPAEQQNVRARERRVFHDLREAVAPYRVELAEPGGEDAETAAKLSALGYLGGGTARRGEKLPDPKAKIGVLRELGKASELVDLKRYAEAAAKLEAVTAANPELVQAWTQLGAAYRRMQQDDQSIAAYRKAMELTGGSPNVALALASVYRRAGNFAEARRHAELALPASPLASHLLLSSVALAEGNAALAEREARAALDSGGAQVAGLLALARAQWAQQRGDEVLATLERAERDLARITGDAKTYPGIHLLRGDVLAATDRRREGTESYKREIEAYPESTHAYARLARVYVALGRRTQGLEVVRQMIATNPDDPAVYRAAVQTLRAMRDFPEADRVARQAAAKFPDDPSITSLADRQRPIRDEDPLP